MSLNYFKVKLEKDIFICDMPANSGDVVELMEGIFDKNPRAYTWRKPDIVSEGNWSDLLAAHEGEEELVAEEYPCFNSMAEAKWLTLDTLQKILSTGIILKVSKVADNMRTMIDEVNGVDGNNIPF